MVIVDVLSKGQPVIWDGDMSWWYELVIWGRPCVRVLDFSVGLKRGSCVWYCEWWKVNIIDCGWWQVNVSDSEVVPRILTRFNTPPFHHSNFTHSLSLICVNCGNNWGGWEWKRKRIINNAIFTRMLVYDSPSVRRSICLSLFLSSKFFFPLKL